MYIGLKRTQVTFDTDGLCKLVAKYVQARSQWFAFLWLDLVTLVLPERIFILHIAEPMEVSEHFNWRSVSLFGHPFGAMSKARIVFLLKVIV